MEPALEPALEPAQGQPAQGAPAHSEQAHDNVYVRTAMEARTLPVLVGTLGYKKLPEHLFSACKRYSFLQIQKAKPSSLPVIQEES